MGEGGGRAWEGGGRGGDQKRDDHAFLMRSPRIAIFFFPLFRLLLFPHSSPDRRLLFLFLYVPFSLFFFKSSWLVERDRERERERGREGVEREREGEDESARARASV